LLGLGVGDGEWKQFQLIPLMSVKFIIDPPTNFQPDHISKHQITKWVAINSMGDEESETLYWSKLYPSSNPIWISKILLGWR
jgi:hypothetical protein